MVTKSIGPPHARKSKFSICKLIEPLPLFSVIKTHKHNTTLSLKQWCSHNPSLFSTTQQTTTSIPLLSSHPKILPFSGTSQGPGPLCTMYPFPNPSPSPAPAPPRTRVRKWVYTLPLQLHWPLPSAGLPRLPRSISRSGWRSEGYPGLSSPARTSTRSVSSSWIFFGWLFIVTPWSRLVFYGQFDILIYKLVLIAQLDEIWCWRGWYDEIIRRSFRCAMPANEIERKKNIQLQLIWWKFKSFLRFKLNALFNCKLQTSQKIGHLVEISREFYLEG